MRLNRPLRQIVFHPAFVVATALIAAALFSLLIALTTQGEQRDFLLAYFMPIGIPFVAWLFERVERRNEMTRVRLLIDAPILALSLTRAVAYVPYISGHALFLTYAFVTSRSTVVRVLAALVMIEVAYYKIVVWHDPALLGGIALGVVAGWLFRLQAPEAKENRA